MKRSRTGAARRLRGWRGRGFSAFPVLFAASGRGGVNGVSSRAGMARSLGERPVHKQMPRRPPVAKRRAGLAEARPLTRREPARHARPCLTRQEPGSTFIATGSWLWAEIAPIACRSRCAEHPPACRGRRPATRRFAPARLVGTQARQARASRRRLCSRTLAATGIVVRRVGRRSAWRSARTGQELWIGHAWPTPSLKLARASNVHVLFSQGKSA